MSLSFRKHVPDAALTFATLTLATSAGAAQLYWQPVVSESAQYNTNLNLDPTTKTSGAGYFTDALVNMGIATPRSDTTLQPRLVYNYCPTQHQRDLLEGFLTL